MPQVVPEDAVLGAAQSSEVSSHSSSDEGEVTLIDTTHSSRTTSIDLTSSRTASIQEEDEEEEVEPTEIVQSHEHEGQGQSDLAQSESQPEISESEETAGQLDKRLSESEISEGGENFEESSDDSRSLEGQQEAISHSETDQQKEASPEVDLSEYDVIVSEELESVSMEMEGSAVIGGVEDSAQRMAGSDEDVDLDSVQVHERFQKYDPK